MARAVLYIANDNTLEVDDLRDVDDLPENAATLTVTLNDHAGVVVAGETWPVALSYVSGTDGRYRTILADALSLLEGRQYTAIIVGTGSSGEAYRVELPCVAEVRRS